MEAPKRTLQGVAITVLVLFGLCLAALLVVVLVSPTSGAEKEPLAKPTTTTKAVGTIDPGAYGIKIVFSNGKTDSAGIAEIHKGEIPDRIIMTRWSTTLGRFQDKTFGFKLQRE